MGIDYSKIREGDLFFCRGKDWLGKLICWASGDVSHVGQFIKPYGGQLFYANEMGWNPFNHKEDLTISQPIDVKNIVSIKRPYKTYDTEDGRQIYRYRQINWHEKHTFQYDLLELFSDITRKWGKITPDPDKKKMICSRLTYTNLCLDKCPIQNTNFDKSVTPNDLFHSEWVAEVEGWQV